MTDQRDDDYWFVPKTHGYGATPANWKGWLVSLAFPVLVLAVTWPLMVLPAMNRTGPDSSQIAIWIAALTVLVALFVGLTKAKTKGAWRWRWGRE